ncbi:MAG: S8 family serine peptidase, partial [Fimbriimonadaceae bacterium]|nr:S8 family serine peptidase [Fimbriimonadaceae bacterium]
MHRPFRPALAFLALLVAGVPSLSSAQIAIQSTVRVDPFEAIRHADYSRNHVLVTWKTGTSQATKQFVLAQLNLTVDEDMSGLYFDVLRLAPAAQRGSQTVEGVLRSLQSHPAIGTADFDTVITRDQVPNDPRFNQQWGLRNLANPGADIRAVDAWALPITPETVVVAVCDDGVDYTHPDLAPVMWSNPGEIPGNGVDDDANGFIDDTIGWDFWSNDNDPKPNPDGFGGIDSHGTHVAGTVAAGHNNGIGIAATSRNARIMAMKMYGSTSGPNFISALANSVDYAWRNGARVISVSYNIDGYNQTLLDSIGRAKAAGVIYLNSAGNNGQQNPRRQQIRPIHDNVLFVAATDSSDRKAGFSNWGSLIEIGSPGVDIMSTLPDNQYGNNSGTSMATPMAAGVTAVVRGAFPTESYRAILDRVIQGAKQVPTLASFIPDGGRRVDMLGALTGSKAPSNITAIATVLGTYVSGDVPAIEEDDDASYIVDSTLIERRGHFATIDVTAKFEDLDGPPRQIAFQVLSGVSVSGVTAVMNVWNHSMGRWETIRSTSARTSPTLMEGAIGRRVNQYMAPDGTVQIRVQYLNQLRRGSA